MKSFLLAAASVLLFSGSAIAEELIELTPAEEEILALFVLAEQSAAHREEPAYCTKPFSKTGSATWIQLGPIACNYFMENGLCPGGRLEKIGIDFSSDRKTCTATFTCCYGLMAVE